MENIKSNKPMQGLITTVDPIDQPDNSLTFALNGMVDSIEGSRLSYQSEPGNEECYELPEGYTSIGFVKGDDNELYVFSASEDSSEIGLVQSCKYETLINDPCLNFSSCHKVKATYRKKNGCDRVIYFVDGNNPDRFFNVDDPKYFQDSEGNWDCNKLRMSPNVQPIKIEATEIKPSGGSLDLGVYRFAVELLDKDENVVDISLLSTGVAILNGDGDWYNIEGGYNVGVDELLGAKAKTNKSIILRISNINTDFAFIRILALVNVSGDGVTYQGWRKGDLVSITKDFVNYTFTGFSVSNNDELVDVNEILVPRNVYETSNAIGQTRNRLVRANLKNPSVELSDLYRATSKVGLKYQIKELDSATITNGSPKDGLTWFDSSTFMGDEVYSFGVSYVYDNGYISPAIPIVGRPKNYDACNCNPLDSTNGGNSGLLTYKCLRVEGKVLRGAPDGMKYRVKIYLTRNGVPEKYDKEYTVFTGFEPILYEPFCIPADEFDQTISNISFEVVAELGPNQKFLQAELLVREYTIKTSPTVGDYVGKAPLVGWDDTVYPYWFEDMSHLVESEEEYRKIIEGAGGIYGDSGAAMSRDNLILLRDALPGYQRWRIFNTSLKVDDTSGVLGYYECLGTTYPEILDCDGNSIWGDDCLGNPIAGQNIRHHRMPDRILEPHYVEELTRNNEPDPGTIRLIGIEACNIEYPHEDIIGHYIVMMERTDEDRTVLDKGWGHRMNSHDAKDQVGFSTMMTQRFQPRYVWMMHPELSFRDKIANGDYLKLEGVAGASRFRHGDDCNDLAGESRAPSIYLGSRYAIMGGLHPTEPINIGIESTRRLPISSIGGDVFGEEGQLLNLSHYNQVVGFKTNVDFPDTEDHLDTVQSQYDLVYSGIKVNKDVYCNLFNRTYFKIHPYMLTLEDDQVIFGGDTHLSQWNISNAFIEEVSNGALSFIIAALVVIAGVVLSPLGGLSLIGLGAGIAIAGGALAYSAVELTMRAINDGEFEEFLSDQDIDDKCLTYSALGSIMWAGEHIHNLWVESDVNTAVRHAADIDCNSYYKQKPGFNPLQAYHENRIAELVDPNSTNEKYQLRSIICPETYLYNEDYSNIVGGNPFFSLAASHDFCNKCEEIYENRIIWSEKSFDSDKIDNYRVSLVNNFKDISANRGAITDFKEKDDLLIVHTENNSVILKPSPQTIKTSASNLYIGTGDFLSLDPVDLVETDIGFGGKQSKYSGINTEFGYLWIDENLGNVMTYNRGVDKVGVQQLDQDLKRLLKPVFKEQVRCFLKEEYTCDDLGVIAAYDQRFERYIFTKIDFELKEEYLDNFSIVEGKVYVGDTEVQFTDKQYFINRCFTLSYDLKGKMFVSYHSYIPDLYLYDTNHFYSANGNTGWRHMHQGNYQTFYGRKYPFIMEPVVKDYVTNNLHSIIYVGKTVEFDELNNKWLERDDLTFDRGLVYNSCGSSGNFDIEMLDYADNPYANLVYDTDVKHVSKSEGNYKLTEIFDLTSAQPALTSDWDNVDYNSFFNLDGKNGFIDCVSLEANINRDDVYQAGITQDKWAKIRLSFNPEDDVKKVVYLAAFNTHPSFR